MRGHDLFARENLVAWCIVPFDAKKRGPEERAAMMKSLGLTRFAYDYRAEHIPSWDAEMQALKQHGIELTAWWFPQVMNAQATQALELFRRHGVKPQLWVTGTGPTPEGPEAVEARMRKEIARLSPIAQAAHEQGLQVALYNHLGWFGEPENQIRIIERLRQVGITNVGIVYNLHHGHEHLDRFEPLLASMKPHLLALNLNGMTRGAERSGKKILQYGRGEEDERLLDIVSRSGWKGPIGILNHTSEDAETRLKENLTGLEQLLAKRKAQLTN
jgi:sugar phosphate isomerase/epimerase